MGKTDANRDGFITLDDLKNMMSKELYNPTHVGRYYVAVSLEEAETIRGIMHARLLAGNLF